MTIFDLQLLFQDKMKPLMTNAKKVFSTTEIERYLNEAQGAYAEELASVFEVNEKARRAQDKLILSIEEFPILIIGSVPLSDNSILFEKPAGNELSRIVEEQVISGGTRITVKPTTHDQYLANIENPFKQPYEKLVWRIDVDEHIELIPDASTVIDSYEVRYLVKPDVIEFDPPTLEFSYPDYIMKEVVSLAVNLAINSLTVGRRRED